MKTLKHTATAHTHTPTPTSTHPPTPTHQPIHSHPPTPSPPPAPAHSHMHTPTSTPTHTHTPTRTHTCTHATRTRTPAPDISASLACCRDCLGRSHGGRPHSMPCPRMASHPPARMHAARHPQQHMLDHARQKHRSRKAKVLMRRNFKALALIAHLKTHTCNQVRTFAHTNAQAKTFACPAPLALTLPAQIIMMHAHAPTNIHFNPRAPIVHLSTHVPACRCASVHMQTRTLHESAHAHTQVRTRTSNHWP